MSAIPIADILSRYQVPGPVSREFMVSEAPVSCLMGPYGSGKTTTNFMKGLLLSTCVPRSPVDGHRYAKGVVIRDTYPNLSKNTIESYKIQFPDEWGTFTGGNNSPGYSNIDFLLEDGSILHQEVIFAAIGDTAVKTFADGFEASWAFINGVDAMPEDLISFLYPRLGRWPPPMHKPADWEQDKKSWAKLSCDMNAPDFDNWTYSYFVEKKGGDGGQKLFKQPGGMSIDPPPENLKAIGKDYYPGQVRLNGHKPGWVRRFVHNKFGYSKSGKPVYENFDEDRHVALLPLAFNPNQKLILGMDAGRNPAAIAMQRGFMSGMKVIGELVPGRMGSKRFGKILSEWLNEKFPNAQIEAYCDPAALDPTQDTDDDAGGLWAEVVGDQAGITIAPAAENNDWTPRYEAVEDLLSDSFEGKPMFQIDRDACPMTTRALVSGFRYGTTKVSGDEVLTNRPVKNEYSHPAEALQYGCLGSSDQKALLKRQGQVRKTTRVITMDD